MATQATEDVLVIGAGPAGLNSAYALEKAGISYKVIDRAPVIGNTWASLYPSLRLNTTRFYSAMPEMRFPLSDGIFPTGKQYYQHLLNFVAAHNFKIELGVDVQRVSRAGALWRVETNHGDMLYKAVISATGIWNNPTMPDIQGMDVFRGTIMHAHDFRQPEQVQGQRVLVVGTGPSGIDIAVASGATAARVYLAIRSGVQIKRRYPFGLPDHAWLLIGEHLPKAWCKDLMRVVKKHDYGDLSRYGLKPPPVGQGGLTAYQGRELLDALDADKVQPMTAPICFDAQGVHFSDGQYQTYDTVIMATGYEPVLQQYLDIEMQFSSAVWQPLSPCDWELGPNGLRGYPLRDVSQHPNGRQVLGHEGLYLVGVFYKGKGAFFNMKIEAAIAAQEIRAYLQKVL